MTAKPSIRSHHSPRSRATRRRIVDAAATLFVADGSGSTTLEQVAQRAGVAVRTVYFHFGNKRTVLREAVDVAAVGDDEPVPLPQRPWVAQMHAERDPRRVLAIWMAVSREIHERVGPIMTVVRDAAVGDPEMAGQWATNEQQRATAFRAFAELLEQRGALRLPVDEAVDVLCALLCFDAYWILTGQRGWTPERWERWMVATLGDALLG